MNSIFNMSKDTKPQMPKITPEQMSMAKSFMAKNNMSAESLVKMICKMRGIDVDEFMEQFKGFSV